MLSRIVAASAACIASAATAVPVLINQDIISGTQSFDREVVAAGGLPMAVGMSGLADGASSWSFDGFMIRSTNGGPRFVIDDYKQMRFLNLTGAMSGAAIGMTVFDPPPQWGLTFEFDHPVNAFGIEVGDWGTCCFPSSLYIAFDGGATREVATADGMGDNPGFRRYGAYTHFVGAFDDSGSFTRVSFYGAGVGEYLVAGGTIRYAMLPVDDPDDGIHPIDLPPEGAGEVPVPAVWTLVIGAMLAADGAERVTRRSLRRRAARLRSERLLSN